MATVIVEVSRPWLRRPFIHRGRAMVRAGWGFFAVAWLKIPFHKLVMTAHDWTFPCGRKVSSWLR